MKQNTGAKNALIVAGIVTILAEFIGPLSFILFGVKITILSIIWAVLLGTVVSPDLLGKIVQQLKK